MEKNELLYAGVLSSGIGFLLQAYSQQNLSPAPVAIIFSLEGVFAAIFGWILLNQFLSDSKNIWNSINFVCCNFLSTSSNL